MSVGAAALRQAVPVDSSDQSGIPYCLNRGGELDDNGS
jgi:hypothetical protein